MTELEKHLLSALEQFSKDQETMFQEFKTTSEKLITRQAQQQQFCETLQQENKHLTQSVEGLTEHLNSLTAQLNKLLQG